MAAPESRAAPRADPSEDEPPAPPVLVRIDETFGVDDLFTAREASLVPALEAFAHEAGARRDELEYAMRKGFQSLAGLVHAMRSYPSLREPGRLGRRERSGETLLETLMKAGQHGLEWSLPTKAVLSRTFGIAKVNFWTAMSYGVQACEQEGAEPLLAKIREAIEEAVYTRLAEELYGSFVTSRSIAAEVRRLAIDSIIDLWEGRVGFATHRFCPILRSAWAARFRAPRVFGTLMGTAEMFSLLFADCDEKFVQQLTSSSDHEQIEAFEEFLFDLPYESLERLRTRMREDGVECVGAEQVAAYLGLTQSGLRPLLSDPKALYVSFRSRRVKAQYRTSMGIAGPKRTAEAYVLIALLREQLARDEG